MAATEKTDVREEAKVAARWWADKLRQPSRMDAGSGDDDRMAFAELLAMGMNAREARERPADAVDRFEDALARRINARLDGVDPSRPGFGSYFRTVGVDYGPDMTLHDAAGEAGLRLTMTSLPWKTTMWVDPGSVRVAEGYAAEPVSLYDAMRMGD